MPVTLGNAMRLSVAVMRGDIGTAQIVHDKAPFIGIRR